MWERGGPSGVARKGVEGRFRRLSELQAGCGDAFELT